MTWKPLFPRIECWLEHSTSAQWLCTSLKMLTFKILVMPTELAVILQGHLSIEQHINIHFGEFFLNLYWNLPTNDIVYNAFLNSSTLGKLCPFPIIGWGQRLKSCVLTLVSTHLDMKPWESSKLDSLFAWHDAIELCVFSVLLWLHFIAHSVNWYYKQLASWN